MKNNVVHIFLAATLSATILLTSGCSSKTAQTKKTVSGAGATPYGKYSTLVTYTLGKNASSTPRMPSGDTYENNAYTRYIKDKLNIQNKDAFEVNAGSAYDQKVAMSIASGSIPDVMIVDDLSTLKQLVDNDMIEDLSGVYKTSTSQKIKDIYNSYNGRCLAEATFDGKLMALPSTNISSGPNLLWLRKDWMDKLGLQAPKTLDDVENILQQFIQKDPGGNGAGKTVGLTASPDVAGTYGTENMLDSIFSLYGAYPKQWMKNSSGNAYYGSVAPEMKPALEKLASMYQKGEIDQQFSVRTSDDINSLLISGKSGAFFGPWWAPKSPLMDAYKLNSKADWEPYLAPLDSTGKLKSYSQNPSNQFVVVRKGYAHPEVVMKIASLIFDYSRYTDKNPTEIVNYTNLGVDRTVMPININVDYNNAVTLAYQHISSALAGKTDPSSLISTEKSLFDQCSKYVTNPSGASAESWANYKARITGAQAAQDASIKILNPVFFGQTTTMKLKWANLQKSEQEALLKIITGAQPVSSFDSFVNTWKQTGGNQITKEVNQAIKDQK